MLALSCTSRYFLYREPININRSFYSLAAILNEQMDQNPLNGDKFMFLNRRRNQVKLLQW
ncbi:IS66 Orf2 like protein [Chitinophaga sp. S165]|nr:IS66 Orf2 like protein [Chitinophaga sp. S165]